MSGAEIAIAGAALISAGVGVASALSAKGVSAPMPSAPAGATITNLDGTETVQEWDAASNSYRTYTRWVDEDKKAAYEKEEAAKTALRARLMEELEKNPAEWTEYANEYRDTYARAAHDVYDPYWSEQKQGLKESLAARGMTGSKADVDLTAKLTEQEAEQNRKIADDAVLQSEGLLQNYRNHNLNLLSALDAGAKSDELIATQRANNASQIASVANSYNTGLNTYRYQTALADYSANQAKTDTLNNTASGLAFLYGYGKKNDWFGNSKNVVPTSSRLSTGSAFG